MGAGLRTPGTAMLEHPPTCHRSHLAPNQPTLQQFYFFPNTLVAGRCGTSHILQGWRLVGLRKMELRPNTSKVGA